MFSFIPQIIILVAIVVLIVIVVKKFPEASKYGENNKGQEDKKGETFGARVLSVIKYIGKRIRIFSVSIIKGIFSGIKKAKREKIEPKNKLDDRKDSITEDLVKNKPNLVNDNIVQEEEVNENQEKVLDLLEDAAEKLGSGNYKEAESNYIEVLRLDPKNVRAYKGLGKLYAKQDNKDNAIASYKQVLKMDAEDSEAIEELSKLNN